MTTSDTAPVRDYWAANQEAWALLRRIERLDRECKADAGRYCGVGPMDENGEYEDYEECTEAFDALDEALNKAVGDPRLLSLVAARPDLGGSGVVLDALARYDTSLIAYIVGPGDLTPFADEGHPVLVALREHRRTQVEREHQRQERAKRNTGVEWDALA